MVKRFTPSIRRLLFCGLAYCSFSGAAQTPSPYIKNFDERDGFTIKDVINDVKADHQQKVWIVSFSSIAYYDGATFKYIDVSTAAHESFLWFKETLDNKPFIVDMIGNVFFVESDTLRAYEYNHLIQEYNPAHKYPKYLLFDQENRLHFTFTRSSYLIMDQGEVFSPLKDMNKKVSDVCCILYPDFKFIAQGTFPPTVDSLYAFTTSNRTNFFLYDDSFNLIDSTSFNRIRYGSYPIETQLPSGNSLLSTGKGNLIEYNDTAIVQVIPYPFDIFGLLVDQSNGLWISTVRAGVHYYPNGEITEKNRINLFQKSVTKIAAQDFQGGLWIYSKNKGLSYFANANLIQYNDAYSARMNNTVNAMGLANDRLIFGNVGSSVSSIQINTHAFNHKKYDHEVRNKSSYQRLVIDSIINANISTSYDTVFTCVYHNNAYDRTWIAQKRNLYYLKGNHWYHLNLDTLGYNMMRTSFDYHIYPSNKSSFWGSIKNRFFSIKDTGITYLSSLYPTDIKKVVSRKDSILVNCIDGMYLEKNRIVSYLGDEYGQLSVAAQDMIHFGNKFWFAFKNKGVFALTDKGLKSFNFEGYPLQDARFIEQDSNRLWILSPVANLLLSKSKGAQGLQIQSFSPLPQHMSITQTSNNSQTLFIGTKTQGIFRINFEHLKSSPLVVPSLEVNSLKINRAAQHIRYDSNYNLSHDQNFFQFSYHATNYREEAVKYRYRLNGLNDNWEYTTTEFMQYPNLDDGAYSFEVQAAVGLQAWGPSKIIRFVIRPPFWETWWFISLSIASILFITYLIFRYRIGIANRQQELVISNLKAKQEALQARMDPHFVFNIIASVQYLILSNENKKANRFLNLFSRAMRNILDESGQSSLSIEQEINILKEYIELERFRMEGRFDYQVEDERANQILQFHIPPFLIQPFIENAIHHGFKNKEGKGLLKLSFEQEGTFLKVVVQDNGVGRKKAGLYREKEKRKSHGINIIQERLNLHNKKKNNILTEDLINPEGVVTGTKVTLFIRYTTYESSNT